jgi:hypothetical protein
MEGGWPGAAGAIDPGAPGWRPKARNPSTDRTSKFGWPGLLEAAGTGACNPTCGTGMGAIGADGAGAGGAASGTPNPGGSGR